MISARARVIAMLTVLLALVASLSVGSAEEENKLHRLAVQISTGNPVNMNLALNNVVNAAHEYTAVGEKIEVEVVAYGPGLHMLRDDTSPVKARVKSISESMPYVSFIACGNTQESMKKAENKEIPLVPQAKVVKSGVVHLMELEEKGWSYIRP